MAATAVQTSPGVYTVTANGTTIPNVSANNLPAYGISAPVASPTTSVIPKSVATPATSAPTSAVNTYGMNSTSPNWLKLQSGETTTNYNARIAAADPNLPAPGTTSSTGVTNTVPGSTAATPAIQPTGNANLDAALGPLASAVNTLATNGQVPATLQITPAMVGTFLSWAHTVVDPQTQAALSAEAENVNNAISNAVTNYQNTQAESVQGFGMNLLNEENNAGNNGTAFSGMRNLNESNMVNSENRTLSTNAANTALSLGNTLNAGAAAVGASNANMFNLPTIPGAGTVSNQGPSTGTFTPSAAPLSLGYNPSIYVAGSIPSSGASNVGNQEANYLNQYSTLAANNSNGSRSVNDLLGMITGAPAGATSNLQ